jgi:iduronate 2-sulfatase
MLDDPSHRVREAAFSVAPMRKGFLLREDQWAYIQYKEDASGGVELFDTNSDPKQYTNLAENPKYAQVVRRFKEDLAAKMKDVRTNDLGIRYSAANASK